MKLHLLILLSVFINLQAATTPDAAPKLETTILDETGVKNLRIETVEAEETTFEETVFALGRIAEIPERHGVLSSRISGRVIGLEAQEGDTVEKDQILVRVESRQPGNPPPIIELKSPIGGLVVESHIRIGEPVEPDKELLDISDLTEVYAIARVPEDQADKLAPGSKAHIRVSALGDQPLEGVMLRFGTSADRASGTIDAIFKVANPALKMRSDMRAEFSIVLSKRENVIGIPRSALQGEASKRFVYVKHFDLPNAFIKTPVQVGQMNDRMVEIVTGLFPADDVVTKGAYSLSFAGGGGGVSLKEALDAAHGHEHAEDGGELTPEKKAEMEAKKRAASGLPPETSGGASRVWIYVSGILFLLLLASLFTKMRGVPADDEVATPSTSNSGKH
jgi:multidrug efflux pump subunit AcrA (membrane-fusion protein)